MAAIRSATAIWEGDLLSGKGTVSSGSSKTFSLLPVSWAARTESPDGKTSPEELIASAHASCFCMALSAGLGRAGTPPQSLETSADVTFDKVGEGWAVTSSALTVRGKVPGIREYEFQEAAEAAKDGCPVSTALKGNVTISVKATLIQ